MSEAPKAAGESLNKRWSVIRSVLEDNYGKVVLADDREEGGAQVLEILDLAVAPEAIDAFVAELDLLTDAGAEGLADVITTSRVQEGFVVATRREGFSPLAEVIESKGSLPVAHALDIAHQTAQVLANMARAGVVHHGLSAHSLWLGPCGGSYAVRVRRQGFRHLFPAYKTGFRGRAFWGSPFYMAPELCSGKEADIRADLYGLGILMIEMLTARPPFASANPRTTMKRQIYEKPLPLRLAKPSLVGVHDLDALLSHLLAKAAIKRTSDPEALLAELEGFREAHLPDYTWTPLGAAATEAQPEDVAGSAEAFAAVPRASEDQIAAAGSGTLVFSGVDVHQPLLVTEPSVRPGPEQEDSDLVTSRPDESPAPSDESPAPSEDLSGWFVEHGADVPQAEQGFEFRVKRDNRVFYVVVGVVALLFAGGAFLMRWGSKDVSHHVPPPKPVARAVQPSVTPKPIIAPSVVRHSAAVIRATVATGARGSSDSGVVRAAKGAGADTPPKAANKVSPPVVVAAPVKKQRLPEVRVTHEAALRDQEKAARESEKLGDRAMKAGRYERAINHYEDANRLLPQDNDLGGKVLTAKNAWNKQQRSKQQRAKERKAAAASHQRAAEHRAARAAKHKIARGHAGKNVKVAVKSKPQGSKPVARNPKPARHGRSPKKPPQDPKVRIKVALKAGMAAYKKGNYKSALRSFHKAEKIDPGNMFARKWVQKLKAKMAE